MATKISTKSLETVTNYEPGLNQWFGITDETTDTTKGTIIRVQVPPQVKSKFHCHENADMFFYVISGTVEWEIGEKKEIITLEADDFIYVPRGEVHNTFNPSETENCEALGGYFGCSNPFKSGKVFAE